MRKGYHSGREAHKKYFLYFLLIWVAQMAAAFYFCTRKQGFHEDEYYTYYSTARTNGFYVEDGQWMDRDDYRNEFVVLPGQRFQYGLVKQVQSWDVHPPMYYWVFHTAASLVPGVFSKWIGLSVNLFFFGVNIVLLAYLSDLVSGHNMELSLLVTLFFGFSPAAISGVVFIRMYEMLTTAVLLCAILHARVMESHEDRLSVVKTLFPMAIVTYVGFLTQYYYFIFLFYLGIAFCVWLLWRDRNLWNCVKYGVSQGVAFLLAYLTYPSCLGQMFHGQRGVQATENFFDWSNTMQRLSFFYGLLDEYVLGKMLPVLLLVILLLLVTVYRQKSLQREEGLKFALEKEGTLFGILVFATAGYFLTVSKTALLLGDTSNRYQLPVYGMIVLLIFQAIRGLWKRAVTSSKVHFFQKLWKRGKRGVYVTLAAICLLVDVMGLLSGRVVFLYPEDREQTAYAQNRAEEGTPAVYIYQTGEEWCVWDISNELFAYPEVCFAAAEGMADIRDDKIQNADSLIVYLAKGVDSEAQRNRIYASNPKLSQDRIIFEEKYCDVYYFSR